jgi:hypothetical protein
VQDDRARKAREHVGGVGGRLAAVDHDGQAPVGRDRELRLEERALLVLHLGAVVVVEARLTDGDDLRLARQRSEL